MPGELNPNQVKQLDQLFTNYLEMLAHDPSIARRFGAHLVISRWPQLNVVRSVNQTLADLQTLAMFSLARQGDVLFDALQVVYEAIGDFKALQLLK